MERHKFSHLHCDHHVPSMVERTISAFSANSVSAIVVTGRTIGVARSDSTAQKPSANRNGSFIPDVGITPAKKISKSMHRDEGEDA